MSLTDDIKREALDLGFDLVGITDASPIDSAQVKLLSAWLESGFAGQMNYMHRNFEKRIHPAKLLDNAQSVIVVGLNFKPPKFAPPSQKRKSAAEQNVDNNSSASCRAQRSEVEESAEEKLSPSLRASRSDARQSQIPDRVGATGRVASYAQYEDYHPFIKTRLHKLADFISSLAGPGHKFKICVDSALVAERALAARARLGFIAKDHMLINPTLGPQIFLGEIVSTVRLQYDQPIPCHSERSKAYFPCHSERSEAESRNLLPRTRPASPGEKSFESTFTKCANCNKCIEACPTGALRPDGQFDANKCISYLTIEYTGDISPELAEKIGDRLFGCDECVLACPYQQNAPVCKNKQFKFHADRANLDLQRILDMNEADFDAEFANSVINRLGLDRLKRNAQICLRNLSSNI